MTNLLFFISEPDLTKLQSGSKIAKARVNLSRMLFVKKASLFKQNLSPFIKKKSFSCWEIRHKSDDFSPLKLEENKIDANKSLVKIDIPFVIDWIAGFFTMAINLDCNQMSNKCLLRVDKWIEQTRRDGVECQSASAVNKNTRRYYVKLHLAADQPGRPSQNWPTLLTTERRYERKKGAAEVLKTTISILAWCQPPLFIASETSDLSWPESIILLDSKKSDWKKNDNFLFWRNRTNIQALLQG